MGYVPTGAGAIVAIAAAKAKKKREREEEKMAGYNPKDLDGWEFKIVRSDMGKFKKYEYVQKVVAEEAKAGWEMVEKFDNNRIRFKRRTDRRSMDPHLEIDPYRTSVDAITGGALAGLIVGLTLLIGAGIFLLAFYLK